MDPQKQFYPQSEITFDQYRAHPQPNYTKSADQEGVYPQPGSPHIIPGNNYSRLFALELQLLHKHFY